MIISDLIGIPFKVHGRDKTGLDCYGLLIEVAKRLGVDFPDAFYKSVDSEDKNTTYNFLTEKLPIEKIDSFEPFCIISMFDGGKFSHVGVYLGEGRLIHSTIDCGVCVQKVQHFKNKIDGLYRIKGVANGSN